MKVPISGVGAAEDHARVICESFRRWTGHKLIDFNDNETLVEQLFHTDRVILSHGIEADPILNYGNLAALQLWEMNWDTFTKTPSRNTAEPMNRADRQQFMKKVSEQGFVDNYTGIRISATGRRFQIRGATVWNLIDDQGKYRGQAAAVANYRYVD